MNRTYQHLGKWLREFKVRWALLFTLKNILLKYSNPIESVAIFLKKSFLYRFPAAYNYNISINL